MLHRGWYGMLYKSVTIIALDCARTSDRASWQDGLRGSPKRTTWRIRVMRRSLWGPATSGRGVAKGTCPARKASAPATGLSLTVSAAWRHGTASCPGFDGVL
jgi:hypothetical protein